MAAEDKLHKLIHSNLELLRDSGYKFDIEKGMFLHPNLPMFEKVGYGLLTVIDPAECRKTIPWPLLEDKSLRSEFRKKFVSFIKTINSKYPNAEILEIPASRLQFPGGKNFLQFMHRLSTFAVWMEITRVSTVEEMEEMLPRFRLSKRDKDNMVKLKIMEGACHSAKSSLQDVISYKNTALPVLHKLKCYNEEICSKLTATSEQLKNEVEQLSTLTVIKERLMDVEDLNAMTDWNLDTEQKVDQLKEQVERLVRLKDLTAECRRQRAEAIDVSQDLCLDGTKLTISPAMAEMAGCPIYNSQGEVSLTAVLKAGQACAADIAQRTPSPSLLPEAQDVLEKYRKLQIQSLNICAAVETSCNESREIITKLRPIVYSYIKKKPAPDHFQYLRSQPALHIKRVCSPPKEKAKRPRVVCSIKRKRSLNYAAFEKSNMKAVQCSLSLSTVKRNACPRSKLGTLSHSFQPPTQPCPSTHLGTLPYCSKVAATSTPDLVTCRKSLSGKLHTGAKIEIEEDISPFLEVTDLLPDPIQPTPQASMRKSISALVERFRKLKKEMDANK